MGGHFAGMCRDGALRLVAGPGGGPHVLAIDGRGLLAGTKTVLESFFATNADDRNGVSVELHGIDLNADGHEEILIRAKSSTTPSQLLVYDPLMPENGAVPWEDFLG